MKESNVKLGIVGITAARVFRVAPGCVVIDAPRTTLGAATPAALANLHRAVVATTATAAATASAAAPGVD